jgi:hypothetical protein
MRPRSTFTHNMLNADSTHNECIRDERAVATPGNRFRAYQCAPFYPARKVRYAVRASPSEEDRFLRAWIGFVVPASVCRPTVSVLPRVFAAIAAFDLDAVARLAVF